ncbi:DEAD/DEAH box helicase [Antribacter sp. KLBMP9083]|uniref:DEAD/DEAH box helicase n=1 Tax=Antribacter soli TaxID=2910976 RepID=A0AA41QGT3_9MICO|nr:DEAD/DEAH box helicase [Antribacter soli]MCF4121932.1 DEAD/DEAH box helicase [Antribacter soli]
MTPSPAWKPAAARRVVAEATARLDDARLLLSADAPLRDRVRDAYGATREVRIRGELRAVPVEALAEVRPRLRVSVLEKAGFHTVTQVLVAGTERLTAAGIGDGTARQAVAAARTLEEQADRDLRFRIDVDPDDPYATVLVQALYAFRVSTAARYRWFDLAQRLVDGLPPHLDAAGLAASRLRRLFAPASRRSESFAAVSALAAVLGEDAVPDGGRAPATVADAGTAGLAASAREVRSAVGQPPEAADVWADFERRSAEYYGLLSQVVDLGDDHEAAEGGLPADVVRRVEAQPLDRSLLRASLRGYQVFGARYALVQRRTILGDEMGLGKTMQSIATMAHLTATTEGPAHHLVVCPASVVTNWAREVEQHSALPAVVMHGADRDDAAARWAAEGGVGVTTFEVLGRLPFDPALRPALLVVDEAHYVKNPETIRGRTVRAWSDRAERVLFLSGTPMENKVAEFKAMVGYLQPEVARQLDAQAGLSGAKAFRRIVAPVYLRRNQEDVLTELPGLVQVEEWEQFGPADGAAYRAAVEAGNFMAMRRAAFDVADADDSAKLRRLRELVEEAVANGRRVIVFSYFLTVLEQVMGVLGEQAVGPLTGSVPVPERQAMVDRLAEPDGPRVLVSQITAGGVGLNVQAASVVIFCEPQVKPTIEAQAVARAHRMGQTRTVQVHRLLVERSVDQRMMEILGSKAALFEEFARQSEISDTSSAAVDVAEPSLARTILAEEQERLGREAVAAAR